MCSFQTYFSFRYFFFSCTWFLFIVFSVISTVFLFIFLFLLHICPDALCRSCAAYTNSYHNLAFPSYIVPITGWVVQLFHLHWRLSVLNVVSSWPANIFAASLNDIVCVARTHGQKWTKITKTKKQRANSQTTESIQLLGKIPYARFGSVHHIIYPTMY